MPLQASDLEFRYTDNATQSTNTLSLGGTISGTTIPTTSPNVFDDVTADESETGDTEYRAIGLINTSATFDFLDVKVWITGYNRAASGADTISFALENPQGSPSSIQTIPDESTGPDTDKFVVATGATVSWTEEGSPSTTLTFGTIPAGGSNWMGIWLRRKVPAGAEAYSNRSCTIKVRGETTGSPLQIVEKTLVVEVAKDAISVYEPVEVS